MRVASLALSCSLRFSNGVLTDGLMYDRFNAALLDLWALPTDRPKFEGASG